MGVTGFLKKAFPFISTAASLGGPLGVMAASAVGKALGVDKVDPSEDGLSKVMTDAFATPEQRLALAKAEQDFQLQLAELNVKSVTDLESLAVQDRSSARAREVAVKDWMPKVLGSVMVVAACVVGYLVLFAKMSADSALAGVVVGYFFNEAKQVSAYYFGSSSGSQAKDVMLANSTPAK